jgi:hypothetical protein
LVWTDKDENEDERMKDGKIFKEENYQFSTEAQELDESGKPWNDESHGKKIKTPAQDVYLVDDPAAVDLVTEETKGMTPRGDKETGADAVNKKSGLSGCWAQMKTFRTNFQESRKEENEVKETPRHEKERKDENKRMQTEIMAIKHELQKEQGTEHLHLGVKAQLLKELQVVREARKKAYQDTKAHKLKSKDNALGPDDHVKRAALLKRYDNEVDKEHELERRIAALVPPVTAPIFSIKWIKQQAKKQWAAILKTGDQMSPLLLRDMHGAIAFFVIIVIFVIWGGSFLYVLFDMFLDCSEDNNCISCAVTIDNTSGVCEELAATSLEIRAGCSTFSIKNNFTIIKDIVETIDKKVRTVWNLPPDLRESLIAHGKIVNALQNNSNQQMIDPKPGPIKAMMKDHWYGISPNWQGGSDKATDAMYSTVGLDEGRFVILHCHMLSLYRDSPYKR